jgi:hypothetical protein
MNFFDFFKKEPKELSAGEVFKDYIGCYFLWIQLPNGEEPSYHSAATSMDELISDCTEFFNTLIKMKSTLGVGTPTAAMHARDIKVLTNAINNLPMFVEMHLKQASNKPFLEFPHMQIYIKNGVRLRQKMRGKYIE